MPAPRELVVATWLAACLSIPLALAPPIRLVPHLFVKVEILGIKNKGTTKLASGTIEVSEAKAGRGVFALDAYTAGEGVMLREVEVLLEARPAQGAPLDLRIATVARLTENGGEVREVRRERRASGEDGASFLHPVYEIPYGGGNVVAAMIVESRNIPEIEPPTAGAPVVFRVALVRVTPQGPVPVEENLLRTLDGSSVSFSFERTMDGAQEGEDASEAFELTLLPRRASDEILMVEATVVLQAGPGGGAAPAAMRRTQAVTKEGTFELTLEPSPPESDPYRLIIRAQF